MAVWELSLAWRFVTVLAMRRKRVAVPAYKSLVEQIADTIEAGRSRAAWSLNAIMSAVYWDIGRQIVTFEQNGQATAEYGERVMAVLADDLEARFGRGFRKSNLYQFRRFYLLYANIFQTVSGKLADARGRGKKLTRAGGAAPRGARKIFQTPSGKLPSAYLTNLIPAFTLPWSHYARLLSVKNDDARKFYETEALRGGWSFRELDRQISDQLYERLALSRDKAGLLRKAGKVRPDDSLGAEEELREPYVLEFLNLKDEYSESDLEEALIGHLEQFLIELGNDFCFVARQRRLRVGGEWYRVDLLFFHRRLRCLVLIDLKVGKFTHADAGQMHLYCNYARAHWTHSEENPPVGLILCAEKDDALARYSLEGLPNKILAREYKLALPNEQRLAAEIEKARDRLQARRGPFLLTGAKKS
jgi:predicted nuclease of restriction endonuclease-like (RecB) superfamily